MNKYIPTVDEWMRSMFIKCQEMEEIRLRFFKKVLFSVQRKLNVTRSPEYEKKLQRNHTFWINFDLFPFFASLPEIYEDLCRTIIETDHKNDLEWWLNNHEFNMNIEKPIFVECVLEEAGNASTGTVASAGDVD